MPRAFRRAAAGALEEAADSKRAIAAMLMRGNSRYFAFRFCRVWNGSRGQPPPLLRSWRFPRPPRPIFQHIRRSSLPSSRPIRLRIIYRRQTVYRRLAFWLRRSRHRILQLRFQPTSTRCPWARIVAEPVFPGVRQRPVGPGHSGGWAEDCVVCRLFPGRRHRHWSCRREPKYVANDIRDFRIGFCRPASNGSRQASGGGRIDSDSVTSDWSDDFLDAISLYGNSSADAD